MRVLPWLFPLLLLPAVAAAEQPCKYSAPRSLDLDLGDAKAVLFEVRSDALRLQGAPGNGVSLQGRACASDKAWLDRLQIKQRHVGNKLIVTLDHRNEAGWRLDGGYAYLDIHGTVPDSKLIQVDVGSGDADVEGVASFSADVGSGDVNARHINGRTTVKVGSGDVHLNDVGHLHVLAVSSGDLEADQVHGPAKIGSVGSGDIDLHQVSGDIGIGSIASGDVDLSQISGNVEIGSIASGDAQLKDVGGDVHAGSIASGDLSADQVKGDVTVNQLSSGDVHTSRVAGHVQIPQR